MRKKAALFDLDGTLADSMWIWDRLLIDFLADRGLEAPDYVLGAVAHMSLTQSSAYVCREFALPMTPEEIRKTWKDMARRAYAEKVGLKPGAADFLKKLRENGIRTAVVTSCDPELCRACLEHNGVYEFFDVFTYADEVGRGKDSPDIYLECLRRLDCPPKDAVLFEDILTALRTAKAAGLTVAVVEDPWAEEDREILRREADLYIRDFRELL